MIQINNIRNCNIDFCSYPRYIFKYYLLFVENRFELKIIHGGTPRPDKTGVFLIKGCKSIYLPKPCPKMIKNIKNFNKYIKEFKK